MANWERKSSYLLREIVKFRTYIDSLTAARVLSLQEQARRRKLAEDADATASSRGVNSELNREGDGPQLGNEVENGRGGNDGGESVVVTAGVECGEAEVAVRVAAIDSEKEEKTMAMTDSMDGDITTESPNIVNVV